MKNKNIVNIIRYMLGVLLIIGMLGMTSEDAIECLFMGMLGVSLLPVFYDKFLYSKFKINKSSYLHIIIPIVLFLLMCVFMPVEPEITDNPENVANNNIVNEEVIQKNNTLEERNELLEENNAIIEENKVQEYQIEENEIDVTTSSSSVTTKKPTEKLNDSTEIKVEEPKQETITPSEPVIEEPKQEIQPIPPVEEVIPVAPTPSTLIENTNNSKTVYRTPTGKRYHLDPDCGGPNSKTTTLDNAVSVGLTPCQKCAQ